VQACWRQSEPICLDPADASQSPCIAIARQIGAVKIGMETFAIRRMALLNLALLMAFAFSLRAVGVLNGLSAAQSDALLAFPFAVVFPILLFAALAGMKPSETREGALMRLGVMIQLVLIVLMPGLALYLALGLPVVFLMVEIFETRCPARLREIVAARLVA
jgi:hypothetical protein